MKRILCLTVIAALAAASVAIAAKPVKGATYSGKIRDSRNSIDTFPISFKVSKSGKQVSGFKLTADYPSYCQGGGFPTLGTKGSGKVSKQGAFTAKLPLLAIGTNKADGFLVVTGKFGKRGSVSGKVRTDIAGKFGHECNGTSSFSART
jgi:hypothetical protein